MKEEVILQMEHIAKTFYGVSVLEDVSLTLHRGEVMSLCGENGSGKSTLMNILIGMIPKNDGEIIYKGENINFTLPQQAIAAGIVMIEQELNIISERKIYENFFLGQEITRHKILEKQEMIAICRNALSKVNLDIDPETIMSSLSLAEIQLVQIAKAVAVDAQIIIMDEPTSAIGEKEVETLYQIIDGLKKKGTSIIYISHRLKEIFRNSDTVIVLRDGHVVTESPVSKITPDELVEKMIGRTLTSKHMVNKNGNHNISKKVILELDNFSNTRVKDINLKLHTGEVLGIFGLMGAGRTELLDSLFGVNTFNGNYYLYGKKINAMTPPKAIKHGMAYLTEDRKGSGILPTLSIQKNMLISNLDMFIKYGIIQHKKVDDNITKALKRFNVKCYGSEQIISNLSGGNQQKALFAKWFMPDPDIIFLDEPTRGIDVGAKLEIYNLIQIMAAAGKAIIIISSELPEIISISDRILVLNKGTIVASRTKAEFNETELLTLAS